MITIVENLVDEKILAWLGWIVAILATFVAFRGIFHFSINEFLRDRRKILENRYIQTCPHVNLFEENGEIKIRSTFKSPFGTTQWRCELCGTVVGQQSTATEIAKYWAG